MVVFVLVPTASITEKYDAARTDLNTGKLVNSGQRRLVLGCCIGSVTGGRSPPKVRRCLRAGNNPLGDGEREPEYDARAAP